MVYVGCVFINDKDSWFLLVCCDLVTMQAQKEAPVDMQCKDKFLLQSVKTNDGATTKDITPEVVVTLLNVVNSDVCGYFMLYAIHLWDWGCVVQ